MKCLTSREVDRWLSRHGHDGESDVIPSVSFYVPTGFGPIEGFAHSVLRDVFVRGDVLFLINDTDLGLFSHLRVVEGLRCLAGEKRALKKAPGFLFAENEWEDAVTLFSFAASCRWQCYLWGEREKLTLFNWEGEIFDVWPGNEKGRKVVLDLLKNFKLKRIIRRSKTRTK